MSNRRWFGIGCVLASIVAVVWLSCWRVWEIIPSSVISGILDSFVIGIPLIIAGFLYFLPTILGWNKKNAAAICVLNLFAGWTGIGWLIALVWACCSD
jgi:hypothetical protein